jgi:hypothetical protein
MNAKECDFRAHLAICAGKFQANTLKKLILLANL